VGLSCTVLADPPMLGFDLRFHSGYRATFGIKTSAAAGGWLHAVIRLTPAAPGGRTVVLLSCVALKQVQNPCFHLCEKSLSHIFSA
jgi:hypothetical protein